MSILSSLFYPAKYKTGVYKIVNRKTGWVYVGATTQPMVVRWVQHRKNLRGNWHHNARLQADWNTYGSRAFRFKVIEVTPADRAFIQETHWQRVQHAIGKCYNPDPDAPGLFRRSHIPRDGLLEFYRLLRRYGVKREEVRPALKEAGIPLNNNLWRDAQPPEPEQRTPIAGRPTDAEYPYQPIDA